MTSKVAAVAAVLVGARQSVQVLAHGKLTIPASRNEIDGNAGCAHCLNTGGPCGDGSSGKFLNASGPPQTEWTAGSIVPIAITVTAHHRGHYEFRVCDMVLDSSVPDPDSCLNRWVLERATPEEAAAAFGLSACKRGDQRAFCVPFDQRHPERWYLPPSGEINGTHTIYFKVPTGLQCEACTLQWHWWSANSCEPAGDYGCFKQVLQANGYWTGNRSAWWSAFSGGCSGPAGPNGHFGCGEQFWNCADITVRPGSGSTERPNPVPGTTPRAMPTTRPTAVPTMEPTLMPTRTPIATPTPAPSSTPAAGCSECAARYPHAPCIWGDGKCYPVAKDTCEDPRSQGGIWCGEPALVGSGVARVQRHSFRGVALLQTSASSSQCFEEEL